MKWKRIIGIKAAVCVMAVGLELAGRPVSSFILVAQQTDAPVPVSADTMKGLRLHSVPPEYPVEERTRRLPGDATVRVVLSQDGTIERVIAVSATSAAFAKAAVDSVRQWTYKGYIVNGQAVRVEGDVDIHFRMSR